MKYSFILTSKNDNWEGSEGNTSLDRLTRTLRWTLDRLDDQSEIILVDWGSEVSLNESLPDEILNNSKLCIPYLRPNIISIYDTPFSEPHALNAAARIAIGKWIIRIDQDTFPGDRFFQWLYYYENGPKDNELYFSSRRNMEEYQITPIGNEPTDYPIEGSDFWWFAVGCLMVQKSHWQHIRGYDETEIYRNHMEHGFITRLMRDSKLVNLGKILNAPFFHQWHIRTGHESRKQNEGLNHHQLSRIPTILNDGNWGMKQYL